MTNYFQCDKCQQIEPELNWQKEASGLRCQHCATVGGEAWPSKEISELIGFVHSYSQTSPEYGLVTCVFLATALEILLEYLITIMAFQELLYDEAFILVDALLETNQGRSRRLQLYSLLGYGSFPEEVQHLGYRQFMEHWNDIVEARNKSVHGDPKASQHITPFLSKRQSKKPSQYFPCFTINTTQSPYATG